MTNTIVTTETPRARRKQELPKTPSISQPAINAEAFWELIERLATFVARQTAGKCLSEIGHRSHSVKE